MAWARVGAGRADIDALLELERLAHTFAGSGPTFGFEALGEAAPRLEREVHRLVVTPATTTVVQRHHIEAAIDAVERALPDAEQGLPLRLGDGGVRAPQKKRSAQGVYAGTLRT